jgi:hypothetical protein
MRASTTKEPRPRKNRQPVESGGSATLDKAPGHSQPVSPSDDLQVRIAQRAYELYAERGYRHGHALDDWLDAEREILGTESCSA